MSVKLQTEQCLEILNLKGDCTGLSEATLVKMPHCWKSRVTAQLIVATDGLCPRFTLPSTLLTYTTKNDLLFEQMNHYIKCWYLSPFRAMETVAQNRKSIRCSYTK